MVSEVEVDRVFSRSRKCYHRAQYSCPKVQLFYIIKNEELNEVVNADTSKV